LSSDSKKTKSGTTGERGEGHITQMLKLKQNMKKNYFLHLKAHKQGEQLKNKVFLCLLWYLLLVMLVDLQ